MKRVCTTSTASSAASFPTLSDSSPSAPHPLAARAAKFARIETVEEPPVSHGINSDKTILEFREAMQKHGEQIQSLKHAIHEISDTLLVMRRHAGIADADSANGDAGPDLTPHTPKEQRVRTRVPDAPQRAARFAPRRHVYRD